MAVISAIDTPRWATNNSIDYCKGHPYEIRLRLTLINITQSRPDSLARMLRQTHLTTTMSSHKRQYTFRFLIGGVPVVHKYDGATITIDGLHVTPTDGGDALLHLTESEFHTCDLASTGDLSLWPEIIPLEVKGVDNVPKEDVAKALYLISELVFSTATWVNRAARHKLYGCRDMSQYDVAKALIESKWHRWDDQRRINMHKAFIALRAEVFVMVINNRRHADDQEWEAAGLGVDSTAEDQELEDLRRVIDQV